MKSSEWFVYMIECDNGSYYTGIATDVERRFQEHLTGVKGAKFFRSVKPLRIVLTEKYPDRSLASKREYEIKSFSRLQKEKLVSKHQV